MVLRIFGNKTAKFYIYTDANDRNKLKAFNG